MTRQPATPFVLVIEQIVAWQILGLQHLLDMCIVFFPLQSCNIVLGGINPAVAHNSDNFFLLMCYPEKLSSLLR